MRKLTRLLFAVTAVITMFFSSFVMNVSNITSSAEASPEASSEVTEQEHATLSGRTGLYDESFRLAQWNHNLMNIGAARQEGLTGAGVSIAVLDTGFYADHPDMHFVGGQSLFEDDVWTNDHTGHGTHVAGIIGAQIDSTYPGIAPDASIYGIKVYHQDEIGEYGEPLTDVNHITQGIQIAADMGMNIILISSGVTANHPELHEAVRYAQNAGSLIVAAAGNGGALVQYPAAYPEVVAVSSIDANLHPAGDIIYGAENELAAPGVGITSLSTPDNPYGYPYVVMSGSSQAAPHVAGLAALLMQKYGTDATMIRTLLHESAYHLENPELYGYGLAGFLSEGVTASLEETVEEEEVTEDSKDETTHTNTANDSSPVESTVLSNVKKRVARLQSQEDHEIIFYEEHKKENRPLNSIVAVATVVDDVAEFELEIIDQLKENSMLFIDVGDASEHTSKLQLTKNKLQKLREKNISLVVLHDDFKWELPPKNLGNEELLIQYERVHQDWQNNHSFAYRFAIIENNQEITQFVHPFTFHFYYKDQTRTFDLFQCTEKEVWQEYAGEINAEEISFQTHTLPQTFGLLAHEDLPHLLSTSGETNDEIKGAPLQKSGISTPVLLISGLFLLSGLILFLVRSSDFNKNKNTL